MSFTGSTCDPSTGAVDMAHLAYHCADTTQSRDVNGPLTVHCHGLSFPMIMSTDANGLTFDAYGNVVAGYMIVTAEGVTHTVAFNSDGRVPIYHRVCSGSGSWGWFAIELRGYSWSLRRDGLRAVHG